MKLYKRELLDHYHHPRNKGSIDSPDVVSDVQNPTCGDTIVIQAKVDEEGTVDTIMFDGKGCIVSQATASKLTEDCTGRSMEDILVLDADYILDLTGMHLGPTRLQCALLPLQALQKGISNYQKKKSLRCSTDQK